MHHLLGDQTALDHPSVRHILLHHRVCDFFSIPLRYYSLIYKLNLPLMWDDFKSYLSSKYNHITIKKLILKFLGNYELLGSMVSMQHYKT